MYTKLQKPHIGGFTLTPSFMQSLVRSFRNWLNYLFSELTQICKRREQGSRHQNWCRGFTLIEILVVVAIIGILLAILVANFSDARKNSRDKVRMSGLKELQLAIEVYKAQNGRYPVAGCGANVSLWVGPGQLSSWGYGGCDDYITGLVPNFIASLPMDPNQEYELDKGYIYRTDANGTMYKVIVHDSVERIVVTSQNDEFSRIPVPCGESAANLFSNQYAVYSAGFECL